MSKCLFCSKKNFLLYFLKKYYNLMYIGYRYRYRPIRQKIISVFYRYRPIRNLSLSVIISIGRYEKKLIGRPLSLRHTSIYKWQFTATPLSQNNFGPWKSNLHLFFSRKIQILSLILWQFDRNGIIYLKNFREILTLCWWLLRLQKVIQLLWTMLDVWMSFPEKSLAKCQFIWQPSHF